MHNSPLILETPTLSATMTDAPPGKVEAASLTALPREVFDGGEIVILAVKPSLWRPVFESLPWLVVCTALAAVFLALELALGNLSSTVSAQVVLLAAFVRLALATIQWVPAWYVLTNRRVLTVRGVRRPRVMAEPLINLDKVNLACPVPERLVGMGTIEFCTDADPPRRFRWESVPQAEDVCDEIRTAIRNARTY